MGISYPSPARTQVAAGLDTRSLSWASTVEGSFQDWSALITTSMLGVNYARILKAIDIP
jgi:hypothetical protein